MTLVSIFASFKEMFQVRDYDATKRFAVDWANPAAEYYTRALHVTPAGPMKTLYDETRLSAMLWF